MKTTNKLLFELQDGVYDSCIEAVTGPGSDSRMRESLEAALHGFEGDFGQMEVSVCGAPFAAGRIYRTSEWCCSQRSDR
mgnify:CR=1 FL=1